MRVITECRTSTRTHNLFECEMTNYPNKHGDKAQRQTHGGASWTNKHTQWMFMSYWPPQLHLLLLLCTFLRVGICCWLPILTPSGYTPTDCPMFFYSPDCSSDPSSRFSRWGNLGDILIPNTGRNAEQANERSNDHNPTSHSSVSCVYIWSNVPSHDKWLSRQGFLRGIRELNEGGNLER